MAQNPDRAPGQVKDAECVGVPKFDTDEIIESDGTTISGIRTGCASVYTGHLDNYEGISIDALHDHL